MVRSLILSVAGYEVQTASTGDAALRIFHHSHIDLVIADQHLPGINGWTLAAEMKKLKPGSAGGVADRRDGTATG